MNLISKGDSNLKKTRTYVSHIDLSFKNLQNNRNAISSQACREVLYKKNSSRRQYEGHNTPLGYYTDQGPTYAIIMQYFFIS